MKKLKILLMLLAPLNIWGQLNKEYYYFYSEQAAKISAKPYLSSIYGKPFTFAVGDSSVMVQYDFPDDVIFIGKYERDSIGLIINDKNFPTNSPLKYEPKSDTLYFIVTYMANKGTADNMYYGDIPVRVLSPKKFFNRKQFAKCIEADGFKNIVILNVIRMSKEEYTDY